jgi:hypothetical protein
MLGLVTFRANADYIDYEFVFFHLIFTEIERISDKDGNTPLKDALRQSHTDIANLLKARMKIGEWQNNSQH